MLTSRIAVAIGLVTLASPVLAQPAETPNSVVPTAGPPPSDADIVVTARRQNERLIDVPASVTVLGADTLAKTGAQTAADFVHLTPGVTIVTGTAEAGDTQINIRGINGARDAESWAPPLTLA